MPAYLQNKNTARAICLLLSFLIIFPKVLLVAYTNDVLWGQFSYIKSPDVVSQDFMLAALYFFYLRWAYKKNKRSALIYAFFVSGLLLSFLLLDARVRELWLRPINIELIQYTVNNYKDLMSGSDVFLKYFAGFGMTFRRIVFVVAGVFLLLFAILFYLQKIEVQSTQKPAQRNLPRVKLITCVGAILIGLFIFTVDSKNLIYNTEANTVVNPFVMPFKTYFNEPEKLGNIPFEQPLRPFSNPAFPDNAAAIKPFKNVVILILESVRFKEFSRMNESNATNFHMPFLKKIASEGLFQKCYVSVPHTSKSQFAILSGRNPLADIEMRESMIGKVPSIVSLLKETKGSSSHFITVQNLSFENTSGMLKSLGFEHVVSPEELSKYGKIIKSSSFGFFDDALLNYPYHEIKQDKPFVLTFMTIAAHYPYYYPNKVNQEDTSYAAYIKASATADKSVSLLFDKLEKNKLLNDTLVVVVGDHGESFGEHGTFIHNSSMHEEEVTVPLIFWSNDGRLKNIPLRKQARQIDIAPTIAELLGINKNKNYILQGTSLIKHDDSEPPVFMATFFSNVAQAIVHNQTKIILNNGSGKITLYDMQNDPAELNGKLISGPEYSSYMDRFNQYTNYHESSFKSAE